jgi:hypothetical protein
MRRWKPKLLLGLALVLSGGINLSAKDTAALFPITEISFSPGFNSTNSAAASTNASASENWITNINYSFGFIDQSGAIAIPPNSNWWPMLTEDGQGHFAEGLEPMQTRWKPGMTFGSEFGYLNARGEFAIAPQFSLALPFSEGLAAVRGKHGFGYIDHRGKFVIASQFDYAYAFSEGLAEVVDTNHLMGFVDRAGNWVIKPQFRAYAKCSSFAEGLACVPTNDVRIKFPFESGSDTKFTWGYINKKGETVIGFKFKEANAFSEGLAAVEETIGSGYIDKTGAYVIPPKFDLAYNFSEGLARVRAGRDMAFINKKGRIIFTVTNGFWADGFSEGLANVSIRKGSGSETWGYLNRKGDFVIKPQFQQAKPFYQGLAKVFFNGQEGYIDKRGHFVWKGKPNPMWQPETK